MTDKKCGGTSGPKNIFNLSQYDGCTSFFAEPPLLEADGYLIIAIFSLIEAVIVATLLYARNRLKHFEDKKHTTENPSEYFVTAGRTLRSGVVSNAIVAQWTWAATLLQSCNVAWEHGISGPFWYAAGAAVPIFAFAVIACNIKIRAPNAHTILEIIRARWGDTAHKVFFFFALTTNIIVTAMLLLGGASVFSALTGINRYAACMLIPVGVVIKTIWGGLKITYFSSLLSTWIILAAVTVFAFRVYASPGMFLGSPAAVWEHLNIFVSTPEPVGGGAAIAQMRLGPVDGNLGGSFMTMQSRGGFIFGLINAIGNFGAVFVDQSYFTAAIAARPSAAWKSYLLSGALWFTIPFALATSLGLASRAAALPLSAQEASEGLVAPAVAIHFMGKQGGYLIALMVLLAVTSTANQELLAVSKLVSYDIYKTMYPGATGTQILKVTRISMLVFGLLMGLLAIFLTALGVTLDFVYLFMGIAIGGAVAPIYFCVNWDKATAAGAIAGSISGTLCGLITWIVTAKSLGGAVTVATLLGKGYLNNFPMLFGNIASLAVSAIVCTVVSIRKPQNYDWDTTQNVELNVEDNAEIVLPARQGDGPARVIKIHFNSSSKCRLKKARNTVQRLSMFAGEDAPETLERVSKYVAYASWGMVVFVLFAIPLLVLPAGIFSKEYFYFWSILSVMMALAAVVTAVALPVLESKHILKALKKLLSSANAERATATSSSELESVDVEERPMTFTQFDSHVVWRWQSDDGTKFNDFSPDLAKRLEQALTSGALNYEIPEKNWFFDFATMTQSNVKTNSNRKIQRLPFGRVTGSAEGLRIIEIE